jgi:hypothetical protein
MTTRKRTGHCLCGACRWEIDPGGTLWEALCHCASCRRATGAPVVGWIGAATGAWRWTGAAPAVHRSSPGVMRSFCGTCGTPLAYATEAAPWQTDLLAATLTDPADFHPTSRDHPGEALNWGGDFGHLPDSLPD